MEEERKPEYSKNPPTLEEHKKCRMLKSEMKAPDETRFIIGDKRRGLKAHRANHASRSAWPLPATVALTAL